MKRNLLLTIMAFIALCTYAQAPIMTPPDGVEKIYTRTGKAINYQTGALEDIKNSIMTVVTTAEGDVYIQNIVSTLPAGSWVKGHQSGNTISVPTHQVLYVVDKATFYFDLFARSSDFYYSTGDSEITFTIDGENLVLNGTNADGSRIIGIGGFYDTSDGGYADVGGDCAVVCVPYVKESDGIPADAVATPYKLEASYADLNEEGNWANINRDVTVYRSGNQVFFKGLFADLPEGVAKGTIDDAGNVTFAKGQVLGSFAGFFDLYLMGTNISLTGNSKDIDDESITDIVDVVFVYDKDSKTYTLKTPSMMLNGAPDKAQVYAYYTKCVLRLDPTGISAPASADNGIVSYYDLTGKRLSQPRKGIVIKKMQQADGTVKTMKVVIK